MDFTIPENTQRMIQVVRDFIRREVYPLERDFLNSSFFDMLPVLREKREMVKAMGLWAPHVPEEYGGQRLSLVEFAHIGEELGRSPLGHTSSTARPRMWATWKS
jgi:acyl-CoA dehydrogenase